MDQVDPLVKPVAGGDKSWTFLDGSTRRVVRLQSSFIGIGHYEPGWCWSTHVLPLSEKPSEAHVGYVLSGKFRVRSANGTERDVGPGEAFEVRANHDAWVISDEPCIALDFGQLKEG